MASERKVIPGSERHALGGAPVGAPDPGETVEVSVYLKRPEGAPTGRQDRKDMHAHRAQSLKPHEDKIAAFAKDHNLHIVERDSGRRLVKLSGKLADLQAAFGTTLQLYDHPQGQFRARTGSLSAPSDIADSVEAVLGLDNRPVATPKLRRIPAAKATTGNLPNTVTARYGFPALTDAGKGECIAIIELGGGVSSADTKAAFKAMELAEPKVVSIAVDKAKHKAGTDPNSDGEVALDLQVAGAGAPGATLAVYFAPNTDQGFVDAITQAAHDTTHKPSVMSISWGSAESGWTQQAITAMNSAFQDAVELGVSVFAASGDNLATDSVTDGKAHVDFPASSEWVVGCGGTRLGVTENAAESVWNNTDSGTGGGISDLFDVPDYQVGVATLPPSVNGGRRGRGVPDVSGDADPNTGYLVVVDGKTEVIGGTSAVAPLWAGLFALVNAEAGKPVGQPHAVLYANPQAFNDVTAGDNKSGAIGYAAGAGWDACTGLGTPKGEVIAALFAKTAAK